VALVGIMTPMLRSATSMSVMVLLVFGVASCRRERPGREHPQRLRSIPVDARVQHPTRLAKPSYVAQADLLNALLRRAIEAADREAGRDHAVSFAGLDEMELQVLRMARHGPNASWWDYLERVAAFVDLLKIHQGKRIDPDQLALLARRFNDVVTANNVARIGLLPLMPPPARSTVPLDVQTARHEAGRLADRILNLLRAYERFGPQRGLMSKVAALRFAAMSRPLLKTLRGIRCGHSAKACRKFDSAVKQAVAVIERYVSGIEVDRRAAGASSGTGRSGRSDEEVDVRRALKLLSARAVRNR